MEESQGELKSLLMKVKEEFKSWLQTQHSKNDDHGIQSLHFMADTLPSEPPGKPSWKIVGVKLETVKDYFLGLQNHCGW